MSDNDYFLGYYIVLSSYTLKKANKQYSCYHCQRPIEKKTKRYFLEVWEYPTYYRDRKIYPFHADKFNICIECYAIIKVLHSLYTRINELFTLISFSNPNLERIKSMRIEIIDSALPITIKLKVLEYFTNRYRSLLIEFIQDFQKVIHLPFMSLQSLFDLPPLHSVLSFMTNSSNYQGFLAFNGSYDYLSSCVYCAHPITTTTRNFGRVYRLCNACYTELHTRIQVEKKIYHFYVKYCKDSSGIPFTADYTKTTLFKRQATLLTKINTSDISTKYKRINTIIVKMTVVSSFTGAIDTFFTTKGNVTFRNKIITIIKNLYVLDFFPEYFTSEFYSVKDKIASLVESDPLSKLVWLNDIFSSQISTYTNSLSTLKNVVYNLLIDIEHQVNSYWKLLYANDFVILVNHYLFPLLFSFAEITSLKQRFNNINFISKRMERGYSNINLPIPYVK